MPSSLGNPIPFDKIAPLASAPHTEYDAGPSAGLPGMRSDVPSVGQQSLGDMASGTSTIAAAQSPETPDWRQAAPPPHRRTLSDPSAVRTGLTPDSHVGQQSGLEYGGLSQAPVALRTSPNIDWRPPRAPGRWSNRATLSSIHKQPSKSTRAGRSSGQASGRRTGTQSSGRRGHGFSQQELYSLLELLEEMLPLARDEWEAVLRRHEERYPAQERTVESHKRKFSGLHRK